ncbi:ABC transporter ATP-binding protein [Micromonospora sp. NBC_01813]|uniref:ABC transporter ATP-binding protein n=1 Tax=Micromonospora sp. NBC_01813 TaxID=2975988 RepID=UPI002DD7B553|nr:ABC transporter ATP-binding protein [Micromonospora sp. NBC_01813]WSA10790.1 ABC transporter ATP-binding protein [Micromonospora sp. NBC_01813]
MSGTDALPLRVTDLRVHLDGRAVVSGVTVLCQPGEVVAVVGPNGSGKSSLLRAVYRALRPAAGAVHAGQADVWRTGATAVARLLTALPQERPTDVDLTVVEVVRLGRLPHQSRPAQDEAVVREAMASAGVEHLAGRRFSHLSGGERQRVLLARVLAQRTGVLVLDEPTNHLDVAHQLQTLRLVRSRRVTTLAALHDLNLAAAYADRIVLLDRGSVVAVGPAEEVLRPELVARVFGVRSRLTSHPVTGRAHLFLWDADGDPQA